MSVTIGSSMTGKIDKVASTDNSIVRFDGNNGMVQNSSASVNDEGSVEISVISEGVIMKSPNSTRYKLTINDDGSLQTTVI